MEPRIRDCEVVRRGPLPGRFRATTARRESTLSPACTCIRYNGFVMHRFVLFNDEILNADERCISPGRIGFMTGWGVFSTIRISRGVLFEFGRHFRRMQRDALLVRVPFPTDPRWLEERLLR